MAKGFGIPTLIQLPTLRQNLDLCAELNLDFVELNMNLPQYQPQNLDIPCVRRMLKDSGKHITFHLDENLSPCDFNPLTAKAWLDTALRTIELAGELGAPIINMHMAAGVCFTLPDSRLFLFERYRDEYLMKLTRFRVACDSAIGGADILICVENCDPFHGFQREGIDLLLESPRFALTFDIGHDHCASRANESFIMERKGRLRHMHIHDATPRANHLELGTGEIDLLTTLKLADEGGCRCVIEVKAPEALRRSVAYLRALGI